MYEDIVNEMKRQQQDIDQAKEKVILSIVEGTDEADNKRINRELKEKNIKTIDFQDLQKVTGVKNGRRSK